MSLKQDQNDKEWAMNWLILMALLLLLLTLCS